jgi:hypothetical protein
MSINDAPAAISANNPQVDVQGSGNSSQSLTTFTLFPQLPIKIRF